MPVAQSPDHYINSSKGCPSITESLPLGIFFSTVGHRRGIASGATPWGLSRGVFAVVVLYSFLHGILPSMLSHLLVSIKKLDPFQTYRVKDIYIYEILLWLIS
jgi:hypothetical protein